MAFQFPPSPTVNQTFTPVAGTTYRWSGTAWHLLAGPGAFITQAEGDARYASLTNPIFFSGGVEVGQFNASKCFKATSIATYVFPATMHEFALGASDLACLGLVHSSGSPRGLQMYYPNAAPRDTGHNFLMCQDSGTILVEIRSNGGIANSSANNVNLSDERAKEDIRESPDHTAFVEGLRFKRFRYADQPNMGEVDDVTAQDIEAMDPDLVTPFGEAGMKGVYWYQVQQRINSVIPKLLERIKTLEEKLTALEKS